MRLIFCFSRSCLEYSEALRRRAVAWPCWPGAYGRRSTGHFSVKHLVPLRNSFVPSRRHWRQLGPRYRMRQTLRRFGGRQPLCGIGVTSLIDLTCKPAATSAWIADSRPEPGPCTLTCTRRTPSVTASRPACSPATVAANGVDFFEPLKPAFPDEPQEIVFPLLSVMVMVVLLKVAETCATPSASIMRFVFFPIAMIYLIVRLLGDFLLAGDSAAWTLLGAGVGVCALTTNWETPAVTNPAVAADVHESLDVHRDLGAQGALDTKVFLDRLAKPIHVGIVQVANSLLGIDVGRLQNAARGGASDSEDVREADFDLLLAWQIHARNTRHYQPCFCLCFGLRLQMMRVTPCRLMTLQCSQIGFTLLRTFTCCSRLNGHRGC